jgi:hypothetical protein
MTDPPQGGDEHPPAAYDPDESGGRPAGEPWMDPDRFPTQPVAPLPAPAQDRYGRPEYWTPQYGRPEYGPSAQPPGQPAAPPIGQPGYGAPQQYGAPQHYGTPHGYGPPSHGPPPYAVPGQPYGPPAGAPADRSTVRTIATATGVALLVIAGFVVVVLFLRSTELDPAAVERDVAGQFHEREGVPVELDCPDDMDVEAGASYECTGTTADGESVTLRIAITDEDPAAYTWTEP